MLEFKRTMTNHLRHRSYWSKELRLFFVDAAALIDVDELRRCATVSLRRWRLRPGTDSVALRPRKIEKCRRISLPAFRDLQSKTCDAVSSDGYQAVPSKPAAKQDDVQPPKEGFSTSAAHVCLESCYWVTVQILGTSTTVFGLLGPDCLFALHR